MALPVSEAASPLQQLLDQMYTIMPLEVWFLILWIPIVVGIGLTALVARARSRASKATPPTGIDAVPNDLKCRVPRHGTRT